MSSIYEYILEKYNKFSMNRYNNCNFETVVFSNQIVSNGHISSIQEYILEEYNQSSMDGYNNLDSETVRFFNNLIFITISCFSINSGLRSMLFLNRKIKNERINSSLNSEGFSDFDLIQFSRNWSLRD